LVIQLILYGILTAGTRNCRRWWFAV